MFSPTIAIIGSGAVGGYYGARLARQGYDVHFLLRSDYDAVKQNGLIIESLDGNFTLPPAKVNAHNDPSSMPKADLLIVTLKTTANDQFPTLIGPLLKEDTAILTLQNGLGNEQTLADLFGPHRVLGGLAFTCINRIAPGHIRHTDHGQIRLGEFTTGPSKRATQIADILNSAGIHCSVLNDLPQGRWEKLTWNIPFNGWGAALDLNTEQLLANRSGISLVRKTMAEVVATAASIGIQLPPNIIDQKIEQTRTMGSYHTSMQLDRRLHRPLETEAIITKPLAVALKSAVETPKMQVMLEILNTVHETT